MVSQNGRSLKWESNNAHSGSRLIFCGGGRPKSLASTSSSLPSPFITKKIYDFDGLYGKSLYNSIFDARFFARMLGWWPSWKRARESVEEMSFLRSRHVLLIIKQKYNFHVNPLRNYIYGAYFWRAYWDGDQLKERVKKASLLGGKRKKCQNAFFRAKLSFIFYLISPKNPLI